MADKVTGLRDIVCNVERQIWRTSVYVYGLWLLTVQNNKTVQCHSIAVIMIIIIFTIIIMPGSYKYDMKIQIFWNVTLCWDLCCSLVLHSIESKTNTEHIYIAAEARIHAWHCVVGWVITNAFKDHTTLIFWASKHYSPSKHHKLLCQWHSVIFQNIHSFQEHCCKTLKSCIKCDIWVMDRFMSL